MPDDAQPATDNALQPLLDRLSPATEEVAEWGELRLRVRSYLAPELPPIEYVTSARAVVLREAQLLLQTDRTTRHILPGGRIEQGESPESAVRREVLEETGWTLGALSLLGFIHFQHLTPKPNGYAYPYPDFLQVVYTARALSFLPEAILRDEYEQSSELIPAAEAESLPLTAREKAFLRAALRTRERQ